MVRGLLLGDDLEEAFSVIRGNSSLLVSVAFSTILSLPKICSKFCPERTTSQEDIVKLEGLPKGGYSHGVKLYVSPLWYMIVNNIVVMNET